MPSRKILKLVLVALVLPAFVGVENPRSAASDQYGETDHRFPRLPRIPSSSQFGDRHLEDGHILLSWFGEEPQIPISDDDSIAASLRSGLVTQESHTDAGRTPQTYATETSTTQTDERWPLTRWWQDHAKPYLQATHWGYPELFEETPFGATLRAHQRAQISNGLSARLVLYQYDFCDGGVALNPSGQRRLQDLTNAFPVWAHHRLLIEATPERPQLATARRNHVAALRHDSGVPAHVVVGVPTGFMPQGDEALLMYLNLLQQVRSGGGSVGGAGGGGGQNSDDAQ